MVQSVNGELKNVRTNSSSSCVEGSDAENKDSRARRLWRLTLCASGICVCYLSYGVLHEHLFRPTNDNASQHHKPPSLGPSFVLLTQCITNVAVALLWDRLQLKAKRRNSLQQNQSNGASSKSTIDSTATPLPHWLLVVTAGCYVTAMVCSNEAIPYVSYPVQVLVKSCKLIPTMVVGQLAERGQRQLYSRVEWLAALGISLGIVLFQYSRMTVATATTTTGSSSTSTPNMYGLLLLAGSLTMDGALSYMQTVVKRTPLRPPNAIETMLYVNVYALLFLFPLCLVTGQWQNAIDSLRLDSDSNRAVVTAGNILLLNGTVALGQIFIFLTIAWFSPVTTTLITTTRKFGTILLSVYLYGHAFTVLQWLAVTMVFTGLYVAIWTTVRGKDMSSKIKTA
jgi:solute carrier family 35 (UDP-galactose transporter), member B1